MEKQKTIKKCNKMYQNAMLIWSWHDYHSRMGDWWLRQMQGRCEIGKGSINTKKSVI